MAKLREIINPDARLNNAMQEAFAAAEAAKALGRDGDQARGRLLGGAGGVGQGYDVVARVEGIGRVRASITLSAASATAPTFCPGPLQTGTPAALAASR